MSTLFVCIVVSVLTTSTLVQSTPVHRPLSKSIHQSTGRQNEQLHLLQHPVQLEESQDVPSQVRNTRQYLDYLRLVHQLDARKGHNFDLDSTLSPHFLKLIRLPPATLDYLQEVTYPGAKDLQGRGTADVLMSDFELEVHTTALAAGSTQGLSTADATQFAEAMVIARLISKMVGLHFGTTVAQFAQAYATALATGTTQGMSHSDATQFAREIVRIQGIGGLSASAISTLAGEFLVALEIGIQQGMTQFQAAAFAQVAIRIQSGFGAQSEETILTLAQSFQTIWAVAVGQGMTPTQVRAFSAVLLDIEARIGPQPLATVTAYAQQFVSGVAAQIAQGQSPGEAVVFVLGGIIGQSGAIPVISKGTVGSLLSIANVGILKNLGQGVLSNLQVSSEESAINGVGGNLLSGLTGLTKGVTTAEGGQKGTGEVGGLLTGGLQTVEEATGGLLGGLLQGRAYYGQSGVEKVSPNNFRGFYDNQVSPETVQARRFQRNLVSSVPGSTNFPVQQRYIRNAGYPTKGQCSCSSSFLRYPTMA